MSEITKLYENAGIKPTYTDECQMADSYYSMEKDLNEKGILFDDYMKQNCPNKNEACYDTCPYAYNKEFYPPFTTGKQLELIKWLTYYDEVCRMEKIRDGWFVEIDMITSELSPTFKEALANLINKIWQDLTSEEKQQVKGILE